MWPLHSHWSWIGLGIENLVLFFFSFKSNWSIYIWLCDKKNLVVVVSLLSIYIYRCRYSNIQWNLVLEFQSLHTSGCMWFLCFCDGILFALQIVLVAFSYSDNQQERYTQCERTLEISSTAISTIYLNQKILNVMKYGNELKRNDLHSKKLYLNLFYILEERKRLSYCAYAKIDVAMSVPKRVEIPTCTLSLILLLCLTQNQITFKFSFVLDEIAIASPSIIQNCHKCKPWVTHIILAMNLIAIDDRLVPLSTLAYYMDNRLCSDEILCNITPNEWWHNTCSDNQL